VYGYKKIDSNAPPGEVADLRIIIVVRDDLGNLVPGVGFRIVISGASPETTLNGTSDANGQITICLNDVYRARDNLDITTDVTSAQYPDPNLDGRRTTVSAGQVTCN